MRIGLVYGACIALAACAPKPAETSVVPVGSVAPTSGTALPPPDAPRGNGFPGGPGVTLVADQLQEASRDPKVRDGKLPYEERLAAARALLGVQGEPEKDRLVDGVSFVAVGTVVGEPFSCQELVISKILPQWALRRADNKRCGFPYSDLAHKLPPVPSNNRRVTVGELRELAALVAGQKPFEAQQTVITKIGHPVPGKPPRIWYGIGARGKDAPITCWSLVIEPRPAVTEQPLGACGITWPPPPELFVSPDYPAINRKTALADCQRTCKAQEICVIDERTPERAHLVTDADGDSIAKYDDGKHAKAEIRASCAPIPAGCTPLTSACFFGGLPAPPPGANVPAASVIPPGLPREGPCPKDTYDGFAFVSSAPAIVCHSTVSPTPLPSSAP